MIFKKMQTKNSSLIINCKIKKIMFNKCFYTLTLLTVLTDLYSHPVAAAAAAVAVMIVAVAAAAAAVVVAVAVVAAVVAGVTHYRSRFENPVVVAVVVLWQLFVFWLQVEDL